MNNLNLGKSKGTTGLPKQFIKTTPKCQCFDQPITSTILMGTLEAGERVATRENIEASWAISSSSGNIIAQMSTQNSTPENHYVAESMAMSAAWTGKDTAKINREIQPRGPLYRGYEVQGRPLMSTPGGLVVCKNKCSFNPNDRLGVGASSNTTERSGSERFDLAIAEAMREYLVRNRSS